MRVILFWCTCLLVIGCNRKLFPSAHISSNNPVRDTLYYYYDYTEWQQGEMKLNTGFKNGLGLRAMTEMDSILRIYIKEYGYDTAVRLNRKDMSVIDTMWSLLDRKKNVIAYKVINDLSNHLRSGSNILKIRLKIVLTNGGGSGLGFYDDGLNFGDYLGMLLTINNGEINNLKTFHASSHLFMRNYLFTPQRSRKFLDRILR